MKLKLLGTLLFSLTACATVEPSSTAAPRALLFDRTPTLPAVSIAVVPNVNISNGQTSDVRAKMIVGDDYRADVSYGVSGGRQVCASLPSCTLGSPTISGRQASYVIFAETQSSAGSSYNRKLIGFIPVRQVRPDEPGSGLFFNGWCNVGASCDRLAQIFKSVQIEG